MPDLNSIKAEIDHMRLQVARQKKQILTLQTAGINFLLAEALLARMQTRISNLCAERDKLKVVEPRAPKVIGGRNW